MSSPDLTNLLLGVLIRFRQDKVAFMGDIGSMFYQVRVAEKHCSFLRFLWWEDDLEKPPVDYEILVHIFGGTSSPACSTYALKRSFIDYEVKNNKEVEENLKKSFYVDDLLQSVHNMEKAKVLVKEAIEICAEGGFKLTKFTSNNMELLESVPEGRRKNGVKNHDLAGGELAVNIALGIQWNIEEDKLKFTVKLREKSMTRRGMLSIISSIYNPLGLVSPYLLKGKKILQNLCYDSLGWDEKIPENVASEWEYWKEKLLLLKNIQIDRCLKPSCGFENIVEVSLRHFSDASELGYGQCSYIRLVTRDKEIHCCLQIGKVRVSPRKFDSMPRMDLTAAVLSVRVANQLKRELSLNVDREIFWTDSQVALGHIENETKKFKTFVANRVQFI